MTNLGIGPGDLDPGVQTRAVMRLDDITLDNLAGANSAVIRALRSREPILGPNRPHTPSSAITTITTTTATTTSRQGNKYAPPKRPPIHIQQGILLLQAEPRLVRRVRLHQLGRLVAVVVLVGRAVGVPALGQHQDVVAQTQWVGVDGYGPQVHVRVVAGRLAGGGTVEVPDRELIGLVRGGLFGEGLVVGGLVRRVGSGAGWAWVVQWVVGLGYGDG